MVRVLVAVAEGSEEIETITPVNVFRRAQTEVILAAAGTSPNVKLSRGINIVADDLISNLTDQTFDLIIVPGGMPGAQNLHDDANLVAMLQKQKAEGRWFSAQCAAPVVALQPHGLLDGVAATCHPAFKDRINDATKADERVVVSGKCITGQGAGTALEFSLECVKQLIGEEKAQEIGNGMSARLD